MRQLQHVEKLFGSRSRVALLKLLLDNGDKKLRINELARRGKINKRLVSTEIKKLVDIGIVSPEIISNTTFYQLNKISLLVNPLKELFTEHTWYEWERPSRIHHLVLTLEAGLKPMKAYYGYGFLSAHLVFDYDNVTWFFNMAEFREIGKKLIPLYQKKREQIWKDFHGFASTLWSHTDYPSFHKS